MTTERLECGHRVDVIVGAVLFNYYDGGFGTVTRVDDGTHRLDGEPRWHELESHGAPYWAAGSRNIFDPSRMTCVPCGRAYVGRYPARLERAIIEHADGRLEIGGLR